MSEKIKILVLDDEEYLARVIAKNLSIKGYEVLYTVNGHEAIRIFSEESPNICILDVDLNDNTINGIDVLKAVKEKDKNTVCIMFTRAVDNTTIQETSQLGCFDYLMKPIIPSTVEESVKQAIDHIQKREVDSVE